MPVLRCHRVWFYSPGDEAAFFSFLGQIKAVRSIKGAGDELSFMVRNPVSDRTLRDLVALFTRYSIDLRQLRQFENEKNRRWFNSKTAFWHAAVFGTAQKRPRKVRTQT